MKMKTKAENWVDDYVEYEVINENEFIFEEERYKLVKNTLTEIEVEIFGEGFVQYEVSDINNTYRVFVHKFPSDNHYQGITEHETMRQGNTPIEVAVKLLAV